MENYKDAIDIIIYNYFENSTNIEEFEQLLEKKHISLSDMKTRYLWYKKMGIDPNIIHLCENHRQIYDIFDNCNRMFNLNNIEYYYTSGILSYLLVDKKLQRYHHDLDVFVNMKDLAKLENVCNDFEFTFKRQLGDRNDGTKRVMIKLYYKDAIEIPITVFMYVRREDNSIEQNDYYIDNGEFYVEKIYNSPTVVDLSFSNEPMNHNNIIYYAITLEALYLSKKGNRPKDIYDCSQFEPFLDLQKLEKLENAIAMNKKNESFNAKVDPYYDFIFDEFKSKRKILVDDRL